MEAVRQRSAIQSLPCQSSGTAVSVRAPGIASSE